jgi:hypothetical protein
MGLITINEIVREERQATDDELILLFKQYVCETTCSRVIRLMDQNEVKRLLALHLFDLHVVQHAKNRGMVMRQMQLVLAVSKTTMYRWFPASTYKNYQEE